MSIKSREFQNNNNILCEYGCEQKANFLIGILERPCCCHLPTSCPEQRRKNTKRQIGKIPWNKGLTIDDPRVLKNCKSSTETIRIKSQKGKLHAWNKGLTKDIDSRVLKYSISMKESKTGKPNLKLRKPISNKTESYSYFRSKFKTRIYSSWVFPILKRDDFKCVICKTTKNLEVHHLKRYIIIFEESIKELDLNPQEWKNWTEQNILDLENKLVENHYREIGITVCDLCHSILDKYRKNLLKKERKELLNEYQTKYCKYYKLLLSPICY